MAIKLNQREYDQLRKRDAHRATRKQSVRAKPIAVTRALPGSLEFVIPGAPVPKPRQTRRDKWAPARRVVRYREWADVARASAPLDLLSCASSDARCCDKPGIALGARFFMPLPKSWSAEKRKAMRGKPYLGKPDIGNLMKALEDALLPEDDSLIWKYIDDPQRRYDDGGGPRTVVSWRIENE